MTKDKLNLIEINPDAAPIGTVIWLHGLGADGHDFTPIIPELRLPPDLPLRFIFPHAPLQPVTINQGYVMRAWYDIVSLDSQGHADMEGIHRSVAKIHQLIAFEEERGIAAGNILLAGFSQGAVMTLHAGLTYRKKLLGMLALSGYLPHPQEIFNQPHNFNKDTQIFMAHGTQDQVVPYFLGEMSHRLLQEQGFAIEWHSYDVAHSVSGKEVLDIGAWIKQRFK